MGLSVGMALFCLVSRVILVNFDRWVFREERINFHRSMLLNSFFPLLYAAGCVLVFGSSGNVLNFLFHPNVVCHALLAFYASWWISVGLSRMAVRYSSL